MDCAICTARDQSISFIVVNSQTCCARMMCDGGVIPLISVLILGMLRRSFTFDSIGSEKDYWARSKRIQLSVNVVLLNCWPVDRPKAPTEIDVIHASE